MSNTALQTEDAIIECDGVRFTYDGARQALDGITESIRPGEFVCILGGNGSGKSTLAKHMNALLLPDEGTVRVNGNETSDPQATYLIRSTAGMVFQNPDDQLVASLVEDDVAFGPENLGVPTEEIVRRVGEALREVGLVGFDKHETHALSGGQKQRVAIAGVLAMEPKILVLDEASAMLDPRGRKGLMRVCKQLNERGMTIVMITHFMEEAAEADRVIVLDRGRVALAGSPDEVLARTDVLSKLNLEVPFACDLSLALRNLGTDVPVCVSQNELVDAVSALPRRTACTLDERPEETASPSDSADAETKSADTKESGETAADASGTATSKPRAVIKFDRVSFTYDAAESKRRRKRKAKHPEQSQQERAAWGNAPDATWALRDVDFEIRAGEFFGIAGHTGSGKSTLIQHMNGILKPTSGRVLVDGADVSEKSQVSAVRAKVGVVFQYPEHQLFAETVYNDVAFGPRNLGLDEDEVDQRVRESLKRVGLSFEEFAEKSPFELSGGQQRRVAFAGVLAMRPEVLVLDEPVAGLDPQARREFLAMVSDLHDQGLTVVMVSHNMDDLAAYCDYIAVLKEGELFAVGEPERVFMHAAELKAIGLGVPSAQQAANALRDAGLPLDSGILYTTETLSRAIARLTGSGNGTTPESQEAL